MTVTVFSVLGCAVTSGGRTILAPLSFQVDEGDFMTITGPSGSGKSTLLQLLLGFLAPTAGQVLFRRAALTPARLSQLRLESAAVFQEPLLQGNTVQEALLKPFTYSCNRGVSPSPDRVTSELRSVGLSHLDLNLPVTRLSGGEKQRVALATALLLNRSVLIVDEVTSALDASLRMKVQSHLIERGITVVSVSHDPTWIARSQRVVKLSAHELEAADGNR